MVTMMFCRASSGPFLHFLVCRFGGNTSTHLTYYLICWNPWRLISSQIPPDLQKILQRFFETSCQTFDSSTTSTEDCLPCQWDISPSLGVNLTAANRLIPETLEIVQLHLRTYQFHPHTSITILEVEYCRSPSNLEPIIVVLQTRYFSSLNMKLLLITHFSNTFIWVFVLLGLIRTPILRLITQNFATALLVDSSEFLHSNIWHGSIHIPIRKTYKALSGPSHTNFWN
jgi:hypothetical protein